MKNRVVLFPFYQLRASISTEDTMGYYERIQLYPSLQCKKTKKQAWILYLVGSILCADGHED